MSRNGFPFRIWCLFLIVVILAGLTFTGCRPAAEKRSGEPEPKGGASVTDEDGKNDLSEQEGSKMEQRRTEKGAPAKGVKLQYLGHACFLIEIDGFRILTDPYSPGTGYGTLDLQAELITVSHEHEDHNYTAAAPGAQVVRGLTPDALGWEDVSLSVGDLHVTGLATYHDGTAGKSRGRNTAFIFETGDLRLVHLGDLGHLLNKGDIERLRPVNILFIPVGGSYTIDAREAKQVVEQLAPAVVIPMHYKTRATRNWPISELKPFLEGEKKVINKGAKPVTVTREELPESTEIWVMEPAKL